MLILISSYYDFYYMWFNRICICRAEKAVGKGLSIHRLTNTTSKNVTFAFLYFRLIRLKTTIYNLQELIKLYR